MLGLFAGVVGADGGFDGDGGAATATLFNFPLGVAVDDAGGVVYVADSGNARVRAVYAGDNVVATVAGGGSGPAGDGPATAVSLVRPSGVAVDDGGVLYIADAGAHAVFMLALGNLVTVAGTVGVSGFGGDGGAAVHARLDGPRSVAADGAGGLYVADTDNNRVRFVDLTGSGGTISTVVGTGAVLFGSDGGPAVRAGLHAPSGIAFDRSAGALYIADGGNCAVRVLRVASGRVYTFAGNGSACGSGNSGDGGPATAATMGLPWGVAVGPWGDVYVSDAKFITVRRVTSDGVIATCAGGGGVYGVAAFGGAALEAELSDFPAGLAWDGAGGQLLVADSSGLVYAVTPHTAASVSTSASPSGTRTGTASPSTSRTAGRTWTGTRSDTRTPAPTRTATRSSTHTGSATRSGSRSVSRTRAAPTRSHTQKHKPSQA